MSESERQQKRDVRRRFDLACDLMTKTNPDIHLEGLMAILHAYRDHIVENLREAPAINPTTFVRWVESADRDLDNYPEPWGADVIEMFDRILVDVVRDENVHPSTAADALDEWVKHSTNEVTSRHDLPDGFFDVVR